VLFIFLLNYYLKAIYWANSGGSTGYFRDMLVSSPVTALLQGFSYFGSANKSLLIYAPLVGLALWRLPQAWCVNRSLVIFALLVLGGLIGGFALVVVWTDETWGPRYLHSAIAPLLMCLAAARRSVESSTRRDVPLLALASPWCAGFAARRVDSLCKTASSCNQHLASYPDRVAIRSGVESHSL
jgi:hypothetical protein